MPETWPLRGRWGCAGQSIGCVAGAKDVAGCCAVVLFSTVFARCWEPSVAVGGRPLQSHSVPRNSTHPKLARGMGKDGGSRRRIRAAALATSDGPVSPLDRLWPRACRSSTLSAGLFHPGAWNWAAGVGDKVRLRISGHARQPPSSKQPSSQLPTLPVRAHASLRCGCGAVDTVLCCACASRPSTWHAVIHLMNLRSRVSIGSGEGEGKETCLLSCPGPVPAEAAAKATATAAGSPNATISTPTVWLASLAARVSPINTKEKEAPMRFPLSDGPSSLWTTPHRPKSMNKPLTSQHQDTVPPVHHSLAYLKPRPRGRAPSRLLSSRTGNSTCCRTEKTTTTTPTTTTHPP
ncbi:hypothetical protein B0T26DRAFT_343268 [Lasiosphaeria miniovina]|uniref:Uncharacterized protein n=1 Tax=Lasiosphaeria miniovina TaxID=1954250 RepID=A0AA40DRB5_9PEZI|nr:uncharacterized protein B0T26DRAFT_343268 [Lasiosphaeria miniovina]KAK0712670.1 hypothetical protein B0T26DRAFT_343268 [Lasiosphaeria miniovina]